MRNRWMVILLIVSLNVCPGKTQVCLSGEDHQLRITGAPYEDYFHQYTGTPLLKDKWWVGRLTLVNGQTYDSLHMAYDAYNDRLLYYNRRLGNMVVVDCEIVAGFWLNDIAMGPVHGVNADNVMQAGLAGFCFVLVDDSVSLFRKNKKQIVKQHTGNAASPMLGSFTEKISYYLCYGDSAVKVPLSANRLTRLFPEHRAQIIDFIKAHKYSVKREDDLVVVVKEVNRLMMTR